VPTFGLNNFSREADEMHNKKIISVIVILLSLVFCHNSLAETQDINKPDTTTSHYLIGPNDVLNIFIWREPDLTQDVVVMPDGRITFPMVGEIMAQGRTVSELKDMITERLKNFITAPEVTVIVRSSQSRIIYTIGKVNGPGPYPLTPGMTVLQALSVAGGLTDWADLKNIIIVRRLGEKEIQIPFNYKDFIAGKNPEQNILLKPSDTIVVP
jgi:polysaccharide export outer membrane protein